MLVRSVAAAAKGVTNDSGLNLRCVVCGVGGVGQLQKSWDFPQTNESLPFPPLAFRVYPASLHPLPSHNFMIKVSVTSFRVREGEIGRAREAEFENPDLAGRSNAGSLAHSIRSEGQILLGDGRGREDQEGRRPQGGAEREGKPKKEQ